MAFVLLLGVTALIIRWAMRSNQAAPAAPDPRHEIVMPPALSPHRERENIVDQLRALKDERETLQQTLRDNTAELAWLRQENEKLRRENLQLFEEVAGENAAPEADERLDRVDWGVEPVDADDAPEDVPDEEPELPAQRMAEDTAAAFVQWCNRGGPLVGRHFMFARALQQSLPEAVVEPIYRDRAAARPLFREAAADGVEYWLVRLGTTRYLLPQPQSAGQFRELAPAFTGEATPKYVTAVTPALLAAEGGALALAEPGTISQAAQ